MEAVAAAAVELLEVAAQVVVPAAVALEADLEDVQLGQGVLLLVVVGVEVVVVGTVPVVVVVVEHFVAVVHASLAQEDLPIKEAVPEN